MTLWWYQRDSWIDTITWPTGLVNELTEGEKLPGTQLDPPSKPTVVCDCSRKLELAVTFVGTILRHRSLWAAAAVAPSFPEKRSTNGNIFSSYCSCILIIAAFMSLIWNAQLSHGISYDNIKPSIIPQLLCIANQQLYASTIHLSVPEESTCAYALNFHMNAPPANDMDFTTSA